METVERKKCLMCEGELEEVYTFKDFPIYMGAAEHPFKEDTFCDMAFVGCVQCGAVQLQNLIPSDILYANGHVGTVGKTWKRHHEEFCEFATKYVYGRIVEIGGANLIVANMLSEISTVDEIVVFDNNLSQYGSSASDKILLREEFFNLDSAPSRVNCLIHSHVLEHLYNPIEEIAAMANTLEDGDHMVCAVPLIDNMIKDNFTNAMNFEHTYMLTNEMIYNIMTNARLEVIAVKQFSPHVSFYAAKKDSMRRRHVVHDYTGSSNVLTGFLNHYLQEVDKISGQIGNPPDPNNTFIFGGHIFTQYLLNFGLKEELFSNVLDNDSNKIGQRLYGSRLEIRPPKILKDYESPLVVLKAAMYTEEIKKDILENINPNTRFIL